jgi:Reverse transcriptase (RNA-dependent DNA polymerase)
MPFGPTNAPSYFQKMMNDALGDALFRTCFVYLDDVIVFAKTIPELLASGRDVINRLLTVGLKLSGLKSEFMITEVELLGRVVRKGKVFPKLDKL